MTQQAEAQAEIEERFFEVTYTIQVSGIVRVDSGMFLEGEDDWEKIAGEIAGMDEFERGTKTEDTDNFEALDVTASHKARILENLVSGLAGQIERVSNKAQRWRNEYLPELSEPASIGMKLSLKIMEHELQVARDALASGLIELMMPAYQSLKDYSDDD